MLQVARALLFGNASVDDALMFVEDEQRDWEDLYDDLRCLLCLPAKHISLSDWEKLAQIIVAAVPIESHEPFVEFLVQQACNKHRSIRVAIASLMAAFLDKFSPQEIRCSNATMAEFQTALMSIVQDRFPDIRLRGLRACHRWESQRMHELVRQATTDLVSAVRTSALCKLQWPNDKDLICARLRDNCVHVRRTAMTRILTVPDAVNRDVALATAEDSRLEDACRTMLNAWVENEADGLWKLAQNPSDLLLRHLGSVDSVAVKLASSPAEGTPAERSFVIRALSYHGKAPHISAEDVLAFLPAPNEVAEVAASRKNPNSRKVSELAADRVNNARVVKNLLFAAVRAHANDSDMENLAIQVIESVELEDAVRDVWENEATVFVAAIVLLRRRRNLAVTLPGGPLFPGVADASEKSLVYLIMQRLSDPIRRLLALQALLSETRGLFEDEELQKEILAYLVHADDTLHSLALLNSGLLCALAPSVRAELDPFFTLHWQEAIEARPENVRRRDTRIVLNVLAEAVTLSGSSLDQCWSQVDGCGAKRAKWSLEALNRVLFAALRFELSSSFYAKLLAMAFEKGKLRTSEFRFTIMRFFGILSQIPTRSGIPLKCLEYSPSIPLFIFVHRLYAMSTCAHSKQESAVALAAACAQFADQEALDVLVGTWNAREVFDWVPPAERLAVLEQVVHMDHVRPRLCANAAACEMLGLEPCKPKRLVAPKVRKRNRDAFQDGTTEQRNPADDGHDSRMPGEPAFECDMQSEDFPLGQRTYWSSDSSASWSGSRCKVRKTEPDEVQAQQPRPRSPAHIFTSPMSAVVRELYSGGKTKPARDIAKLQGDQNAEKAHAKYAAFSLCYNEGRFNVAAEAILRAGRNPGCDICFHDRRVSSTHLWIRSVDDEVEIEDTSSCGTVISAGEKPFKIHHATTRVSALQTTRITLADDAVLTLRRRLCGRSSLICADSVYPLGRGVNTVGRNVSSTVHIEDPLVCRTHFRICDYVLENGPVVSILRRKDRVFRLDPNEEMDLLPDDVLEITPQWCFRFSVSCKTAI